MGKRLTSVYHKFYFFFLLQEATRHHVMLLEHVKLLQHAEELFYHIDHLIAGCDFFLL